MRGGRQCERPASRGSHSLSRRTGRVGTEWTFARSVRYRFRVQMITKGTSSVFAVVLCALLFATTSAIRADTAAQTPDDIFRADGLVRQGKWLVLQAESDVHQRVWALQQTDEAVRSPTSTHRSLQPEHTRGLN